MRRLRALTFSGLGLLTGAACSSSGGSSGRSSADAAVGAGAADGSPSAGGRGGSSGGRAGSGGVVAGSGGWSDTDGGIRDRDASVDAHPTEAGAATDAAVRPGQYLWQRFYGRSFAAHVVVDSKDAPIVSGTFFDAVPVTLDAFTLTSHGAADIMLSRVLPSGRIDWARSYGSTSEDYPLAFVLDAEDRITLSGLYNGTGTLGGPDFPAFAGSPGRYDVFAAGLTKAGDYRWQTTIHTTAESIAGPGLAVNAASDLFLVGHFLGTARIGGVDHASAGSWDAFVARYDEPAGALSAALTFGGTGEERASAAVVTPGDVVVFGTFQGDVTFPTTPPKTLSSAGARDVFVARVSLAGTMTSVVSFGGTGDEELTTARADRDGSIVLMGSFTSPILSIFGGRALTNAGGADVYVARLEPGLALSWSLSFGSGTDARARDVALGSSGDIAVTGEFRDDLTIGGRTLEASGRSDAAPSEIDAFVAKLHRDGTPLWSASAGGGLPDRGLGVALDSYGAVYLAAAFQSAVDFGGGEWLTPDPGQWASALVKYAP